MSTSRTSSSELQQELPDDLVGFEDLGLSKRMVEQCQKVIGLSKPTTVQKLCIPSIMRGRDCMARSPTGTGKTMAFAIPMIESWSRDPYGIFGLVLTPTRELAYQIKEQFELLGGPRLRVTVIIGGIDKQQQALELQTRPHFVIATPGRLADHLESEGRSVSGLFLRLKYVVYDEADRLLDGQFNEQLECINPCLPKKKQTLLFSATMTETLQLVTSVLSSESLFKYNCECTEANSRIDKPNLTQRYIICPPDFKDGYLMEFLRSIRDEEFSETIRSMIIFVATCRDCQVLSILLSEMGFPNVMLHSHMDQKSRINSLVKFKSSCVQVLVATDVVSRGLDIRQVDLVINYAVPMPTDYVHRVGRVGRAGQKGFSFMLITPRDIPFLLDVEGYICEKITEMKIDEKKVLEILTDVTATKKVADLSVLESDPFEERKKINMRKRQILKDQETSYSEEAIRSDDNEEEGISSSSNRLGPRKRRLRIAKDSNVNEEIMSSEEDDKNEKRNTRVSYSEEAVKLVGSEEAIKLVDSEEEAMSTSLNLLGPRKRKIRTAKESIIKKLYLRKKIRIKNRTPVS